VLFYFTKISSAGERADFGSGVLRRLPAWAVLLYQQMICLLLTVVEQIIHFRVGKSRFCLFSQSPQVPQKHLTPLAHLVPSVHPAPFSPIPAPYPFFYGILSQHFFLRRDHVHRHRRFIGVGKTTLARMLQPAFNSELLLEVFEKTVPLGFLQRPGALRPSRPRSSSCSARTTSSGRGVRPSWNPASRCFPITPCQGQPFARINLKGDELEMYKRGARGAGGEDCHA